VFYRDLAAGGVGLIISGDTPGFLIEMLDDPSLKRRTIQDMYFDAFGSVADEVHRVAPECKMIMQLGGPGRGNGIGPSDVPTPFREGSVKPLSVDEIQMITDAFAETISRVKESRLDGVQIHGAHGHGVLQAFLSPYSNRRADAYGGSAANRAQIIRELVSKARDRVGDYPILIKMNCTDHVEGGIDLDTFPEMAKEIERTGVDAIEVSGGSLDCLVRSEEELGFPPIPPAEARTRIGTPEKQSYYLEYVKGLRLDIPVILVGGNRNVERLEGIVQRGDADFVALCRPLINEPDLPNRWLEGRGSPTTDCISCNSCIIAALSGQGPRCLFKHDKEQYKAAQEWLVSYVKDHRVR
jgi:2,4-dienoyl-CoA reductase-like NADH-dependent reductase (Old Yellow Enzyme family)